MRLRPLRLPHCLFVGVVAALLLVVVAVGSVFVALARGPIASDWLAPKIVEALDELYTHRYQFSLDRAAIAGTEHGLTLTVDNLTVKTGARVIVAAPRAQLSVDPWGLLVGRLTPRRLEALDLELRLSVLPDGVVAIAAPGAEPVAIPLEPPAPPERGAESETAAVAATAPVLRQAAVALRALMDFATSPDSPIAAIDKIGVSRARLVIDDRTLDKTIVYDELALSFDKAAGATTLRFSAAGPAGRVTVEAEARGVAGERRALDLRLRRLSMEEIALIGGSRSLPFDTDAPLSLDLHFALAGDGRVVEANGRFAVGEGFFRLEEPDSEPIMLAQASVEARWDIDHRLLVVEPILIDSSAARLGFAGVLTPPTAPGEFWSLAIALARRGVFPPGRPSDRPLVLENAGLAAKIDPARRSATIERLFLEGPELHVSASGVIDGGAPDGAHLKYTIQATQTPLRALLRIWPTHVAPPTRVWMDAHVPSGMLRNATLTADFDQAALIAGRYERPPPDGALRGDFELADATIVEAIPGLWPLTGVAGQIALTGRTAAFTATAGVMETAPGRRLALSEGVFRAPALGLDPAPASIELRLSGNVEAAADVLSLESVASAASLPLESAALKGQVDGRLRVDFELGLAARPDHTHVVVDAETSNLSIEHFIEKERLESAALRIVADQEGLRVSGAGRVFGAPVTLALRQALGEKAQAQMSLQLDDAARARAGYGFAGVSGVVGAQVQTKLPIGEAEAKFELDFAKAAFDHPLPGLVKPLGKPGRATFTLLKRPDGLTFDQLTMDTGAQQIAGIVDVGKDGALRSARLSQVRMSPGDDMRIEATRGSDALKLVVRGANVDARPMLRYLSQPSPEPQAGAAPSGAVSSGAKPAATTDDFDLDLKSPIVSGFGKQILSNVDLKLERRGGRLRQFGMTGNFGREPLAALLRRQPNGASQIDLSTSDGGALLSFLDLYHRMESGALSMSLVLGPAGHSDGAMQIQNFYLRNEPAIRQLVMQGAARPDDKGALRFDPDSVKFARVQSAFSLANGRMTLRDAVMSGPDIGLTVDGYIDMARDRIDVSGSFVPAYGLNNLVSNIPVLGLVLAGGRHEGVFAVSFRVSGAFSAPVLTVNPLSVIAPGLLRKVFGIVDGTGRFPEGAPQ